MKLVATESLSLHPEASRVPEMPPDQFAEFVADIEERGVLVPIEVISGNTIIDGRTRWLAAQQVGIGRVPIVEAPLNGLHPVIYMLRAASQRRHLTDDQRACLAQEEMEVLAAINRQQRATAGGKAGGRGRPRANDESSAINVAGKQSDRDRSRESRPAVAASYGISQRKVQSAQRLQRDAPTLYGRVKSGQLRLGEAKREAERTTKREEQRKLAEFAAKTIPADKTWQVNVRRYRIQWRFRITI